MTRENTRLDKRKLRDAEFLFEQRMCEFLLFAFLVRLYSALAPGVGELHRAALARSKIFRADLLAIDECDRQPVSQPRAKFLHQIQRQRRPVRAFRVEIANKRVKPDAGERGDAI